MQAESRSPPRVHASVSRLNSADVYGPDFSHGRLGPDWHAATIATAARTSATRTFMPAFYHWPLCARRRRGAHRCSRLTWSLSENPSSSAGFAGASGPWGRLGGGRRGPLRWATILPRRPPEAAVSTCGSFRRSSGGCHACRATERRRAVLRADRAGGPARLEPRVRRRLSVVGEIGRAHV